MTQQHPRKDEYFRYFAASPDLVVDPSVVVRDLCVIAEQAQALYESDDWERVRQSLTAQGSRAETVKALRTVAFVAQSLAESLSLEEQGDEHEPVTMPPRAPMNEPPQELDETPPNGPQPSEGEEVWADATGAQEPAEKRRSWWSQFFGS